MLAGGLAGTWVLSCRQVSAVLPWLHDPSEAGKSYLVGVRLRLGLCKLGLRPSGDWSGWRTRDKRCGWCVCVCDLEGRNRESGQWPWMEEWDGKGEP